MESRTKDLTKDLKSIGREAKEIIKDTAEDWSDRTLAAGNAALESAKATYEAAQNKAIAGAKMTDKAIRENPYKALGIAFGVGLLLGFLCKRK